MAHRNILAMMLVATTLCCPVFLDRVASADCPDAVFGCMESDLIVKIQSTLGDKDFAPGKVDGRYGNSTERALKQFSKSKDIKFEGYLTPNLSEALFGIRIDYMNATEEELQKFNSKLGLASH